MGSRPNAASVVACASDLVWRAASQEMAIHDAHEPETAASADRRGQALNTGKCRPWPRRGSPARHWPALPLGRQMPAFLRKGQRRPVQMLKAIIPATDFLFVSRFSSNEETRYYLNGVF